MAGVPGAGACADRSHSADRAGSSTDSGAVGHRGEPNPALEFGTHNLAGKIVDARRGQFYYERINRQCLGSRDLAIPVGLEFVEIRPGTRDRSNNRGEIRRIYRRRNESIT